MLSIVDSVQDEIDRIEEENKAVEETAVDRAMFGKDTNALTSAEEEVITDEQQ